MLTHLRDKWTKKSPRRSSQWGKGQRMVLEAKGEISRTEKWLKVSNATRRASILKMKKKKNPTYLTIKSYYWPWKEGFSGMVWNSPKLRKKLERENEKLGMQRPKVTACEVREGHLGGGTRGISQPGLQTCGPLLVSLSSVNQVWGRFQSACTGSRGGPAGPDKDLNINTSVEKGKRADWRQEDNELSEGPDEFQQHDCVEAPFSTMGETLQLLRRWVQERRQDPEGGFHSRWVGRMRGQRSWETQVWLPCVSSWTYPNISLDLQPQTHFSPPAHWGVFLPHLSRW